MISLLYKLKLYLYMKQDNHFVSICAKIYSEIILSINA